MIPRIFIGIFFFCYVSCHGTHENFSDPFSKRVVNGVKSKTGQWPWLVAIHQSGKKPFIICGGALIDKNTVLTAAHCFVHGNNPKKFSIIVGSTSMKGVKRQNRYKVSSVRLHSGYSLITLTDSPHDIAIMKLSSDVKLGPNVKTIELATGDTTVKEDGATCYGGGWGLNEKGKPSLEMYHTDVKTRPMDFCRMAYRLTKFKFPKTQLCAGGFKDSNVCQGDSGGPLSCKDKSGKWILQGVVSFGQCNKRMLTQRFPAVYTKVSAYLKWIGVNRV